MDTRRSTPHLCLKCLVIKKGIGENTDRRNGGQVSPPYRQTALPLSYRNAGAPRAGLEPATRLVSLRCNSSLTAPKGCVPPGGLAGHGGKDSRRKAIGASTALPLSYNGVEYAIGWNRTSISSSSNEGFPISLPRKVLAHSKCLNFTDAEKVDRSTWTRMAPGTVGFEPTSGICMPAVPAQLRRNSGLTTAKEIPENIGTGTAPFLSR